MKLVDIAIVKVPLTRAAGDVAFVARAAAAMTLAQTVPDVHTCVTRPAAPSTPKNVGRTAVVPNFDEASAEWFAARPGVTRGVTMSEGEGEGEGEGEAMSVHFVRGSCSLDP